VKSFSARTAAVLVAGAVLAIGGCSVNHFLTKEELEKQSFDALTEVAGYPPAKVECPDSVKAEAGQTTRCVLTAKDGSQIGYTITVKSYDEDSKNAQMDIKVDETPIAPAPGNAES
jgi:hypothetical protein